MPNPQADSSAGYPTTYDPYTDDGILSPSDPALQQGDGKSIDVKAAGMNTDTRDGALRYGKTAPRIT